MKRPWTHAEIALLRRHYGTLPACEIGRHLPGRTAGAIREKARQLGIVRPHFKATPAALAKLAALTQAGYSEAEIAAELRTVKHTVRKYRRQLGLVPATREGQRYRRAVARRTRAQCRAEGARSLIDLRRAVERLEVVRRGYPPEVTLAQARVLDALGRLGQATQPEIAREIGVANVTHLVLPLERLGLVAVDRWAYRAGGRNYFHVYRLAKVAGDVRKAPMGRALFAGIEVVQ